MTTRDLKALEIAATRTVTFRDGVWHVPAQSEEGSYKVRFGKEGASCTCDDWGLHFGSCKHILAARIVADREGGKTPQSFDTDEVPKKPTYKQNWPAYRDAQHHEKRRFKVLLADLCKGVKELPYKGGRPRTSIADVLFAVVYKVYSTLSTGRFGSDLMDAQEQGFMSCRMHPNRVNACLEEPELTPILRDLIVQSSLPLKSVETTFATDSSGFSTSRFVRWYDEKYGIYKTRHHWIKAHICCGVKTNIVTAVEIADRDAHDSPMFKTLIEATATNFKVEEVVGDKAYLSNENLELVERLGAIPFVPFKVNSGPGKPGSIWEKMFLYNNLRREEFLGHYHKRSNVESTFSMVKAKFRDHVRSKTSPAMENEVYAKFLCHNICVVIQSQCELGIDTHFWPPDPQPEPASRRNTPEEELCTL